MVIEDSGTTGSCAFVNDNVVGIKSTGNNSVKVSHPNGTSADSTCTGFLPIKNAHNKARSIHLFLKLNKAFLSLGQFCATSMKILLMNDTLLSVMGNSSNKLMQEGSYLRVDAL